MASEDTPGPSEAPVATVLVVGAASRDITSDDPRGWRLGGPVVYASLALARLGLGVHSVIGVDEEAGAADELDVLRGAAAEVELVPLQSGPVFENIERPEGRRQRCLSASDHVRPDAVPAAWRQPDALFLAPVAAEL